jgi:alpha-L-fucosidase
VLREFRRILDDTFADDLTQGRPVTADNHRQRHRKFAPSNLVDGDSDTYWATDEEWRTATIEIDLGGETYFDRVMLQEPIRFGQRIAQFVIEAHVKDRWIEIASGTTIGYKRLLRIPGVSADGVRLRIERANNAPALSRIGLFRASSGEPVGALDQAS